MFDISEKLIAEQSDEIYGVNTINWVILHGNIYLWSMMKKSQSIACKGLRIFKFCVMPWKMSENPQLNYAWEDKLTWFKSSSQCSALDTIDGEPMEFEWNIFQGLSPWPKWAIHPHLCLFLQKDFQQNVGHSWDLDQKRSGILPTLTDHKENGTESLDRWWSDSEKEDTQFSEPRVHCPEERSKAKEVENYRYTSVSMEIRLKPFFSHNYFC